MEKQEQAKKVQASKEPAKKKTIVKSPDGDEGITVEKGHALMEPAEYKTTKPSPKKLCILGTAETMTMTPWDDKSCDIWGVATCLLRDTCKRLDMAFEIHKDHHWHRAGRLESLQKAEIPIMMIDKTHEVPNSVRFPIERIWEKFPERKYFTNTIAMMIAYAMVEGYREIALFGVHMATTGEYTFERPNCEYWLGRAEQAGINLYIPDGSDMLKSNNIYGYEESKAFTQLQERATWYRKQQVKANQQAEQTKAIADQYKGAIEVTDYVLQVLRT